MSDTLSYEERLVRQRERAHADAGVRPEAPALLNRLRHRHEIRAVAGGAFAAALIVASLSAFVPGIATAAGWLTLGGAVLGALATLYFTD